MAGIRAEVDFNVNTAPAVRSMQKATDQINKVMGGMSGKGTSFKINERSFTQPLGRITGSANEFTKSLEASNARVIAFGASVGILNGISNAFKNLVAETIKFEKVLADVNVILNASNASLQAFGSNLFDVAKNTAQSFNTAATAALEFSRQGLEMNEVLKRTNDALILTRLTGLKAEEAVSGLTAAVNAFGDAGLSTTDIIDKLAAVDVKFAVSSEDLIKALERTGAVAIDAGVEIDSLIGLVAALQQTTARGGAVIGNGLKTIFTRIQRPESLKQLESMDMLVKDLSGSVLAADKILLNIAKKFDTLTQAQQSNVVQFGAGIFQANIFRAALRDLGKEQSLQVKATDIAANASGNAAVKNKQLNKTIAALASQSLSAIQELASVMGDLMVKPEIGGILEFVKAGLEGLKDMLGGGEEQGSSFAKGLVRGIGNIITGPAAIAFGMVFIKLFMNIAKFARTSLKDVLGIISHKDKIKQTEESIIKALSTNSDLQHGLNNLAGDHVAQEAFVLKMIEAQTNAMREQQRLAKRLAGPVLKAGVQPDLTVLGPGTGPVDLDGDGQNDSFGTSTAGGVLPSSARKERKEASRGGYSAGAVDSMSIKGLGKVVYNKAEEVKQFPGMQQPAIMPPKQSRAGSAYKDAFSTKHGFDPYAARGFVPNFADLYNTGGQLVDGETGYFKTPLDLIERSLPRVGDLGGTEKYTSERGLRERQKQHLDAGKSREELLGEAHRFIYRYNTNDQVLNDLLTGDYTSLRGDVKFNKFLKSSSGTSAGRLLAAGRPLATDLGYAYEVPTKGLDVGGYHPESQLRDSVGLENAEQMYPTTKFLSQLNFARDFFGGENEAQKKLLSKGFVPNFATLSGDILRLNQSKMHLYANPREAKPGGDAVRKAMMELVNSGKPVTVRAAADKLYQGGGGSHTKAIKGLIRFIAEQEGGPKTFERDFRLTNLPWKGNKGEDASEDAVAKLLNKDGKKYINTGKRPGAHGDKTFPVDLIGEGLDPVEVKSGEWKQPNILLKSMRLYSDDELIQFAERQYGATPEMLKGARMEKLGKSARLLQGKGLLDKDASLEDQHNAALKYGIAGGFVPNFAYRGGVDREKLRRGLEKFIQDAGGQSEEELLELPSMKGLVGEVIDPNAHFTNLRDIINNKKNQGRTILQPEANKVEEITPEESQRLEGAIEKVRNIFNKKNKLEDSSVSKKAGEDFQDRIAIESGKTLDEVGAYDFPEGITGVAGVPDTKHPVDAAINGHNRNAMVNKAVRYVLAHQEKRDVLRRMIEGSRARGEINLDGLTGEVLEVLERQGVDGNTVSGTTGADQIKTKNMTEEEKSVVGLAQEKGVKFAGSYTQYSSAERPVVRPPGAASGFIPNFAGYTSAFRGTSPKYQKAIPDIPNPPQFLFDELMAAETKEKFLEAAESLGRQHSMGKYSGSYNDNIRAATLGEIRGREKLGINEVHHGGYVYPRPVKGGLGTQGGVDISPAVQPSGFVARSENKGVAEGFAKALVPGSQYDPKLMGQVHESVIPNSRILNKERIEKYIDRYGLKAVKQSFKEGMKSGKLKDLHLNLHKFGKNEYGAESIGMSGEGLSRDEEEIAQFWGKNSPYYGEASGYVPNFVRWLPNPKGGPAMPAPDLDPMDGKPRGIYSGADVQEMRSKGYAYSDSKGWHYKGQAKGIGLAKTENNNKYMSGVAEPVSIRYLNSIKEFDRSKKSFLGWGQPGGDDRFSSLEELGSDMIKREVENALIIGYDSRQNMLQLIEGNHRLAAINEKNIAGDDNYATLPAYVSGTNIRGGNYGDGADYLKGITNRKGEPSRLPAEVEKYLRESESSGRPLRALQGRWKPSEFGIPNFADERTRKQKISDVLGDPSNAGINFQGGVLKARSIKSKNMLQKMWLESYFKRGLEGDYQMLMKMGYDPDTLLSLRSHAEKGGEVNILGKGFVPNFADPLKEAIAREAGAGIPKSQIRVEQSGQLRSPGNPMGLAVTNKRDEPLGVGQGIRRARSMGIDPKRHGAADGLVPNFVGQRTRERHGQAKKAARDNEALRQGPIDPANLEKQASLAEQNNKLTAQEIAARKVLVDSLKKSTKAQKEATEADEKGTQETVDNTNDESQASSFGLEKLFFFQSAISGVNGFLQEFSAGATGATKTMLGLTSAASDTLAAFIQQKAMINETLTIAGQEGKGLGIGNLFGEAKDEKGKGTGKSNIKTAFADAKGAFGEGKAKGGMGGILKGVMGAGKVFTRLAPVLGQAYTGFTLVNKAVGAFAEDGETLTDMMSSGATRAAKRLEELSKVTEEVTGSLEKLKAAEQNQEKIKELETKGVERTVAEEKELMEVRTKQLKLGQAETQVLHRMAAMNDSNLTAEKMAGEAFAELTRQGKSTTEALKGIEEVVGGASFAMEGLKSAQESINALGGWDMWTDQEFSSLKSGEKEVVKGQFNIMTKSLFNAASTQEEADYLKSTLMGLDKGNEVAGIDEDAMRADLMTAINSGKLNESTKGMLTGFLKFGEIMDDEIDAFEAFKESALKMAREAEKQRKEQKEQTISFEDANRKSRKFNAELALRDKVFSDTMSLEKKIQDNLRQENDIRSKMLKELGGMSEAGVLRNQAQKDAADLERDYVRKVKTIHQEQLTAQSKMSKDIIKQGMDVEVIDEIIKSQDPQAEMEGRLGRAANGITNPAAQAAVTSIGTNLRQLVPEGGTENYKYISLAIQKSMSDAALEGKALFEFIQSLKEVIGAVPTQALRQQIIDLELSTAHKLENAEEVQTAERESLRIKKLEALTDSQTLAGAILKRDAMVKSVEIFEKIVENEMGILENAKIARENSFNAVSMFWGNPVAGQAEVIQGSQDRVKAGEDAAREAQRSVSKGMLLDKFNKGSGASTMSPLESGEYQNMLQPILTERVKVGTELSDELFKANINAELQKNKEEELKWAKIRNQLDEKKAASELLDARFKLQAMKENEGILKAAKDRLSTQELTLATELKNGLIQQQVKDENKKQLESIRKLTELKEEQVALTNTENLLNKARISRSGLGLQVARGRVDEQASLGLGARSAITLAGQTGRSEDALSAAQKIQEYNRAAGKASEATDHLRVRMAELAVSEDMLAVELIDTGLESVKSGWRQVFETIADGSKDADEAWRDFGLNIIKNVLDKFTEKNIEKIIGNLTYAFTGVGGKKDIENQRSGIIGDTKRLTVVHQLLKDLNASGIIQAVGEIEAANNTVTGNLKTTSDILGQYNSVLEIGKNNHATAFSAVNEKLNEFATTISESTSRWKSELDAAMIKARESAEDVIREKSFHDFNKAHPGLQDMGPDKNWQRKDQSHIPNSVWAEIAEQEQENIKKMQLGLGMTPGPDGKLLTERQHRRVKLFAPQEPAAQLQANLDSKTQEMEALKNKISSAEKVILDDKSSRHITDKFYTGGRIHGDEVTSREAIDLKMRNWQPPWGDDWKFGKNINAEMSAMQMSAFGGARAEETRGELREAIRQKEGHKITPLKEKIKGFESIEAYAAELRQIDQERVRNLKEMKKRVPALKREIEELNTNLFNQIDAENKAASAVSNLSTASTGLADAAAAAAVKVGAASAALATAPGLPEPSADANGSSGTGGSFLGGKIQKFNKGGFVDGPAGVDQVPAMLTKGEFVLPREKVKQMWDGGKLEDAGLLEGPEDRMGALYTGLSHAAVTYAVTKAMSDKKAGEPPTFNKKRLNSLNIGSDISMSRGDSRMSAKFRAKDPVLDEYSGHLIELAQYKTDKKNAKFQEKMGYLTSIYGALTSYGLAGVTDMLKGAINKGMEKIGGWASKKWQGAKNWVGEKWQGAKNWAGERWGEYGDSYAGYKGQLSSAGINTDHLNYSNFAATMDKGDAFAYGGRMYEPGSQKFQDIGPAPAGQLYSGPLQKHVPKDYDAHVMQHQDYWNDMKHDAWAPVIESRTRRFNAYTPPSVETEKRAMGGMTGGSVPTMLTAGEGFIPAPIAQRIGYNNLDHMNSTGEMPTVQGPGGRDNVGPMGLSEGDFIIRKSSTDKLLNNNPNMMRFAMQNPDGFRRGAQGYYEGGLVGGSDLTMSASSLSPQQGRGPGESSLGGEVSQETSKGTTAQGSSETTNNISINVSIDSAGSEKMTEGSAEGSYEEERNLSLKIKSAVLDVIREEKRIGGELS